MAKRFFPKALRAPGHPHPRVINVDGNASYTKVVTELKRERRLGCRCRCRTCPYLNNIERSDDGLTPARGSDLFRGTRQTIQGYEVVHMIRKGHEVVAQRGRLGPRFATRAAEGSILVAGRRQ